MGIDIVSVKFIGNKKSDEQDVSCMEYALQDTVYLI